MSASLTRFCHSLVNMKGSTIDAMSDAIDRAEIMLYTVSLPYKESANCRLEATCETRKPLACGKA